jgi:hypothetical protein
MYSYLQICGVPWFEPRLVYFGYRECCIGKEVGDSFIVSLICLTTSTSAAFSLFFLVRFFVAARARRLSSSAWYGATSGNYLLHFVCVILLISYNKSLKLGLWYLCLMSAVGRQSIWSVVIFPYRNDEMVILDESSNWLIGYGVSLSSRLSIFYIVHCDFPVNTYTHI